MHATRFFRHIIISHAAALRIIITTDIIKQVENEEDIREVYIKYRLE